MSASNVTRVQYEAGVFSIMFSDDTGIMLSVPIGINKQGLCTTLQEICAHLEQQLNPKPPEYKKLGMMQATFPNFKPDGTVKSLSVAYETMYRVTQGPAAWKRLSVAGAAINAGNFQEAYDALVNFVEWRHLGKEAGNA